MRVFLRLFSCFSLCIPLLAGHQTQPASQTQTPVFRAGVDYVLADVVVTDSRDQPIRGLTKDDFEVVMNGRRLPVLEFKEMSIPAGDREIVTTAFAAAAVDVARNEPATTGRQMVLVIDDLHILPQDIVRTREAVRDFLRFLSNGDQIAVVFTGRSELGIDFTSDLARLGVVVDRIREASGFAKGPRRSEPTVDQSAYPRDDDRFDPEETRIALLERRTQAEQMMFTLRNVGRALAESTHPHRALILISSGTDFDLSGMGDGQELLYQLRKTFDEAQKANVRVYTLDPRGLVLADTATAGAPPRDPYEAESIRRRVRHQQQYLRTVAENTGGLAMVAHPNLTEAMRQIIIDNGSFYLLGFNAAGPLDGRFHEFDIRVVKPGVRVRARRGYAASGAKATTASLTSSLDAALGLGMPVPGVLMQVTAAPLRRLDNGRVRTAITARVTTAPPPPAGAAAKHDIYFAVLAVDREGKAVASKKTPFAVTVPANRTADLIYELNAVLDLPTNTATLRAGVASALIGRTGTVHLPLTVPNLKEKALTMAGIALGRTGTNGVTAARYDAIADLVPFQPTTDRTFAVADTLEVFTRLSWRGAETRAAAMITLRTEAGTGTVMPITVEGRLGNDGQRTADVRLSVPLSGSRPGKYLLDLSAALPGGNPIRRVIAIEVR